MSVEKTKLTFFSKGKISEEQVMVETIFNATDAQKVLWVEAAAELETIDVLGKEVSFSGQTQFFALYLDQENKVKTFETTVPFIGKAACEELTVDAQVDLTCFVSGVEYVTKNSKLQCVVGVQGGYLIQNDTEILCGGDEDVCVKTAEISAQELIKAENITFTEDISYPISDKMENILRVKSTVCVKNIEPNENFFTISGEIHTCIKYLNTNDEIARINTVNFSETFRREIEVSGLTEDGIVEAVARVDQSLFKYELDNETNKILISVPIKVLYRACSRVALPSVQDVFSISHNTNIITSSIHKFEVLRTEFFENKIEGSVQIDASLPRIDKIVGFSNPNIVVTGFTKTEDGLVVEGTIGFSVAFLNDELEQISSIYEEIPFKISVQLEDNQSQPTLVNANFVDVDVLVRRGREIYIDGKLKTMVQLTTETVDAAIIDLQFTEELPIKTHAIEIYFGQKGDDLWDIAKELRVQPEIIVAQNPELVLPLEEPENIVIYSTKTQGVSY